VVTFCTSVAAQGRPADKAAAETLFQQGKQLMDENKFAEACAKFLASQDLDDGLGVKLYLADCYESSGRTASAWALFEEAASVAAARGEAAREQIAHARADTLKPRLSYLNVRRGVKLPPGTSIKQNGNPLPIEALDVPIPVDPGQVSISISAPGYAPVTVTVGVPVGSSGPVEVTLPELAPLPTAAPLVPGHAPASAQGASAPDRAPLSDAQGLSSQQIAGLALGGAGVLALGASVLFSALGGASNKASRDNCSGNDCNPEGKADRDEAINRMTIATALGLTGAVAVGAGTGIFIAAPKPGTAAGLLPSFGVSYSGVW